MNNHLHIDAFSGVSGDMFLGALVDAGVPLTTMEKGLRGLGIKGYRLRQHQVRRSSVRATKVDVDIRKGFTKPLSLRAIRQTLTKSRLPDSIRSKALSAFQLLAEAEGAVHGTPPQKVHFHEVGVIDSLVDVVGTLLGVEHLEAGSVSFSPVNLGAGTIATAHGLLPVPGPAVAELARGVPVCSTGPAMELTTPTGIALVKTLSQDCRPLPLLTPHTVAYGAGTADPEGWPNVLRLFIGPRKQGLHTQTEQVVQLETNIDDMNPQLYEPLMRRLFDAGALDVTLTPTMMKRQRPGILLAVLAEPAQVQTLTALLFEETPTLGVRVQRMDRYVLPRSFESVRLPGGTVRMKIAHLGNGRTKASPEFQDCAELAAKTGRPVQEILDQARHTFAQTSKAMRHLPPKKRDKPAR